MQELFLQKIIAEGVAAIAGDIHPRMVERKLKAYLTPSARQGDLISLEKIKEQFNVKKDNLFEESQNAADPLSDN